jgi:hypothetical protein
MSDVAVSCIVRVPRKSIHWPGDAWLVVGHVTGWLMERRQQASANYRVWEDFACDVQVHETDDREYAAVLAGLVAEGWDGAAKVIDLVEGMLDTT